MATQTEDTPLVIEAQHLHFVGKPDRCAGFIALHNPSAAKIRIKSLPLASSRLSGPVELSVSHLRVFARLCPGASLLVPARLPIPPDAPPGQYKAELLAGKTRKPLTVDVLESWDLAVVPEEVSFKLHRQGSAKVQAQLRNRGNMPYVVPRAGLAPLQEEDGIHRNIFLAIKNTPGADYEKTVSDFFGRMRETIVEPARIKIVSGTETLGPGETGEMEIEILPPDNLKKNRRYHGAVSFENARLLFDIEVLENSTRAEKEKL
jgi:hypothetical protein